MKIEEGMGPEEIRRAISHINSELYERLVKIDNSDEFFEYTVKSLRTSIRINTLKADLDYVVERLSDIIVGSVPWCREGFFVSTDEFGKIPEHQLGIIFAQEASSIQQKIKPSPALQVSDYNFYNLVQQSVAFKFNVFST